MGWVNPGGAPTRVEFNTGVMFAVGAGGSELLAGMYCAVDGSHRVELRDVRTGEVLDVRGSDDDKCWHEPAICATVASWQGDGYVMFVVPQPNRFALLRVDSDGFGVERGAPVGAIGEPVTGVAMGVLDTGPAVLTCDARTVHIRGWRAGGQLIASRKMPAGWRSPRLVTVGSRCYAWLRYDVPDEVPPPRRWRVAAEHGRLLWDPIAGAAVGPPLLVRGIEWGPWVLDDRPVALLKVDWREFQVWDLVDRRPLGPALGDLRLSNPSVGSPRGRATLAATIRRSLCAWDIRTGRLLGQVEVPDPPIATAIGRDGTVWAMTSVGHLTGLDIGGPVG